MDPDLDTFVRLKPEKLHLQCEVQLDDTCTCLALSKDAQLLAAGSCDATIMVYSNDLEVKCALQGHKGGTNSVAFSSGSKLVSAGEDGHAAVWDCSTGVCLACLECEGEHTDR